LEAINAIMARHPKQRVGIVAHELPIAVVLCRSAGLGLENLRDMIPRTGTWSEVVLEGALK
jgi:broad specificity phosphatase PhoE